MPNVITVANQKGGVGKTTISFHLAWIMQEAGGPSGLRVLAIDMDASGNLSSTFKKKGESRVDKIFTEGRIDPIVVAPGLDLLPSATSLVQHDSGITGDGLNILRRAIDRTDYDFVIIDAPPSLGRFLSLCLAAANLVIVPVHATMYALEGMTDLKNTMDVIRESYNPGLSLLGYVVNRFERTNAENDALRVLKENVGEDQILSIIPKSVKVEESLRLGKPIWKHEPTNPVALAYRNLAVLVTGSNTRQTSPDAPTIVQVAA